MVHIHMGNLMRTDRPLTWLSEPTCDRCSLPFNNYADDLYNRLPLLLSCSHLLCGLCVREHANSDSIMCERCNKYVPFPDNYDPSYYMLGMLAQMQQELKHIELYYEEESKNAMKAKGAAATNGMPKDFTIESIGDISTMKKMKSVIEEAFDSYEKTKHVLDKRAKSFPENVDRVVQKINAHFLTLHNALQIEQDRVLKLIRKTYLEQQHHTEQQHQHLLASKNRMIKLHKRLKNFQDEAACPDDKAWLQFSVEVKQFLETEPLKLASAAQGGSSDCQFAVFFTESDKFCKTISGSYRLKVPDLSKAEQLVPFPTSKKKHLKVGSDVAESCKKEAKDSNLSKHTSRDRKLSDHSRHHEPSARKAASVNEQSNSVPTHSTQENKLSDQNKHYEPAGRKTVCFIEQTIPAREKKHGEESVRCGTSSQRSSREKRRSKTGLKLYEPRGINEIERTILERCFSTVTVTYIVNPHEIYVRDELHDDIAAEIVELCRNEAKAYETKLLKRKHKFEVKVDGLYLVQPENTTNWYRALVLEAFNTTPKRVGPYTVQYVDYGGKDTVEHEQMRPMSIELSEIEWQAMRCSLYNVDSIDRTATSWPAECYQLAMDFIGNRKMMLYEVESASDCRSVDIFLPPIIATEHAATGGATRIDVMSWNGYYPPMSLRTTLITLQQCVGSSEGNERSPQAVERVRLLKRWMTQATEQAQKRWTIRRTPELTQYDFFDVHITYSKSPDHFYIMPMEWKTNTFDKLQEQLNEMCEKPNAYKVFCPYVGLVCGFALDTEDSERIWLRGRIETIVPGSCWMYALDTGETIKVSCNDLYLFPPNSTLMSVYPLAVGCSLEHIRPKSGNGTISWSGDAIEEFNLLLKSKTLRFAVTMGSLWNESKVYSVLLYLRNKSDVDTCVNRILVAQGHAECIMGREAEINDLVHKSHTRQAIDKAAPAATEAAEPSNKVIDPRVPVDLLRVISPDEIYVRLSSRKGDLDGLQQAIQQHMDETLDGDDGGIEDTSSGQNSSKSDWSPGDMCLVFTSPSSGHTTEWYRARITEVQEEGELYEAFLIDRALTLQVHRTNVARMVPRIAQLQPGAVRCQLACIEPLKGSDGWQKVTVDGLHNIIDSYEKHAISLDANRANSKDNEPTNAHQSLSVVLWGVRVLPQQALAPQKTEYRNINQMLVVRGLAHSSGRFRTLATVGNDALEELQSVEEAVEKMTRGEYKKLKDFFRAIAAVSAETEGFGAREDGNETAKVVLNGKEMPARVEIDGPCATVLTLVKDAVDSITDWPVSIPIEKTVFVGMPTHIGNDGTVFLIDLCQQPVLNSMRDTIQEYVAKNGLLSATTVTYKPGEPCLARYHLDEMFYRATVVAVIERNKYRVLFVDYGNEEMCHGEDLRKDIVCGRVPVQTNRFRLSGIVPEQICKQTGTWPEDAIILSHGLIVQQLCKVHVDTSIWTPNISQEAQVRRPIPCNLFRLNDLVDVRQTLLEIGNFKSHVEQKDESDSVCDTAVSRVSNRYEPIDYQLANAAPERSYSPRFCTPEQRDLMQFVRELDTDYDFDSFTKKFEDPNEMLEEPNDDSDDYLNRAQVLNVNAADLNDDASDDSSLTEDVSVSSLLSSFNPDHLDSSTRLSADELHSQSSVPTGTETDPLPRASPFASPIDPNRTAGFFANFVKYGPGLTVHLFPHIEGHSLRMINMTQRIQRLVRSQPELLKWQARQVEVGEPCLAPYSADGFYYRAIIEKVFEESGEVSIMFVDYLNRDTVAIADLRKCPKELRNIPLRNAEVQLKGVRVNQRLRQADIGRRMLEVLIQPFYVRITPATKPSSQPGETLQPEVELFSDYERGVLAYDQMIKERFLYTSDP
uniref:Tudor domain-containing protein n=1 Tax=Anopheles funestus TaxID=62324 RepID=A0A182RTK1_ANOFN